MVGLARDRSQLWAEAAAIEAQGVSLVLPEKLWGDATRLQDERRDHDPWEDSLSNLEKHSCVKKVQGESRVMSSDILDLVLRLPMEKQTDIVAKRMAFCLRRLGWDGPKAIRDSGRVLKGYTKGET